MAPKNLFSSCMILAILTGLSLALRLADLPPGYQQLSAKDKLDILWNRISAEPYNQANLPLDEPSKADKAYLLLPSYDAGAFTTVSDELPEGRLKLIHTIGSTAKIELKIYPNSRYTGVFQSGGIGVARLSLAQQNYEDYPPGMGLKILIDGQRSQNCLVMYSLDGQGPNKNFFANIFTSLIPSAKSWLLKPIEVAFNLALAFLSGWVWNGPEEAVNLGQYEQAAVMANGTAVKNVKAPYILSFRPNPAVGWNPNDTRDLRIHLNAIPAGSRLYTVYAQQSRTAPAELIGELVTTSGFVASYYQDQKLYFQHATQRWKS